MLSLLLFVVYTSVCCLYSYVVYTHLYCLYFSEFSILSYIIYTLVCCLNLCILYVVYTLVCCLHSCMYFLSIQHITRKFDVLETSHFLYLHSLPQEDSDFEREHTPPTPPVRKLSRKGASLRLGCIGKQSSDENPLMRRPGQPLRVPGHHNNQVSILYNYMRCV